MRLFPAQPRARRARAVTASAQAVTRETAPASKRLQQDWQRLALQFYRTCGECWYPAQGYARSLQKVRFYPAVLDDRGDPQEIEDGPLVELFDRVQDPGGGRTELVGNYGRLMFLTGEGQLTVTLDEDGEEAWEFLSAVELQANNDGDGYLRRRGPGIAPEELMMAPADAEMVQAGEARVWRLWRRDPEYSSLADSPIRGVLDLYEVLQNLTLAVGARGKSRAANRGGIYMPDELDFGPQDSDSTDEDPQADPFFEQWIESQVAAIKNPGSAAAMSPIAIRGPALMQTPNGAVPMKDCMGWFAMGPDDGYLEMDAWDRTIDRIANGLDLPVPYVTGRTGESENHWGGWIVDEQAFRLHIAPVCQRFCDDVTSAYLRPAAMAEGVPDADRVVVAYDPAGAVNHPDEINTWKDAYDRKVVSAASYRDRIGATDEDAPDEAELASRMPVVVSSEPEGETPPDQGGRGGDTNEQPPSQNGDTSAATAAAFQVARVIGAAEVAVERARELAGSRLIRRAKTCEECGPLIADVPSSVVASALGSQTVREIIGHSTEASLVAGAGVPFAATLQRWGLGGQWPAELGRLAEQHALRTLYEHDPPPLPAGFVAVVSKALR